MILVELGTCENCNRKGRLKNLTFINNKSLCPACCEIEPKDTSRYHFMHFSEPLGKKRFQVMDFKIGQIFLVDEDEYLKGEIDEEIRKAIDVAWESKIISRTHYYRG